MPVIDEKLLREPNLLTPGKKPVGNVEIDWDQPLAKGLRLLLSCNNGGDAALINQTTEDIELSMPVLDTSYIDASVNINGKNIANSAPSTSIPLAQSTGSFADYNLDNGLSFLTIFSGDVSTKDLGILSADASFQVFLDTSGGNLRLALFNGSITYGSNLEKDADGAWNATIAASIENDSGTYYGTSFINGKKDISRTSIGVSTGWTNVMTIMGVGVTAAKAGMYFGNRTKLSLYAIWDHPLNESELRSLSLDPYQILKPA
jgi:hypothetical protein